MSLNAPAAPHAPFRTTFGDLYLRLLAPDGDRQRRLEQVHAAALAYDAQLPGSQAPLEGFIGQLFGRPVHLSATQLHALRLLAELPALGILSPLEELTPRGEPKEVATAADLHAIYLRLLAPDGGMVPRFKAVQAAAALYEPGVEGSHLPLEQEFSQLLGRPVRLGPVQLGCFKRLFVDEIIDNIAPWADLTASW